MDTAIDKIVRRSLKGLMRYLSEGTWKGCRERELVSLYAFGYLVSQVGRRGVLRDRTQIGLEVPVPQLPKRIQKAISRKATVKEQVCKDLVIWKKARETCWNAKGRATVAPISILEWKFGERKPSAYDKKWLIAFTRRHQKSTGYSICMNRADGIWSLECLRIKRGKPEEGWLKLQHSE